MLVLSRKVSQRIMLDDGKIVITLVAINGSNVRIGIEAPREVNIQREELIEQDGQTHDTPSTDSNL